VEQFKRITTAYEYLKGKGSAGMFEG